LDAQRVYVGGISGGAKSAFRALMFYPEVFRGAVLSAGVEYFRALPARSNQKVGTWPQRIGTPRDLGLAKTRPVAITTGPIDFNYGHISDVVAAMHEDGFARVQVFSRQDLGHAPPPTDMFDQALTWVDCRQ
jgi:pimeloyl-ACP methyl ester carboxylesterase